MKRKTQEDFFTESILTWNRDANKRQMPWKGESDPYKIWISEIILQQTRVEQGWNYYLRFIEKFPTIGKLAAAPDAEVFKLWEGLGYYSRCRNLLAAARQVVNDHGGDFPRNYEEILALKGVGAYTAAAIGSFAFNLPYAVVDGNVIRVLARFFGISEPFDSTAGRKYFAKLAQDLLPARSAAAYNQAIMDFGASVCKPADTLCHICPIQAICEAYCTGRVKELPVKSKKLKKRTRWFCYWMLEWNEMVLIKKRVEKDIWQDLHELVLFEEKEALVWTEKQVEQKCRELFGSVPEMICQSGQFSQQLTHQTIHARFFSVKIPRPMQIPDGYQWIRIEQLDQFAFPKLINNFLKKQQSGLLTLY